MGNGVKATEKGQTVANSNRYTAWNESSEKQTTIFVDHLQMFFDIILEYFSMKDSSNAPIWDPIETKIDVSKSGVTPKIKTNPVNPNSEHGRLKIKIICSTMALQNLIEILNFSKCTLEVSKPGYERYFDVLWPLLTQRESKWWRKTKNRNLFFREKMVLSKWFWTLKLLW